MARSARFALFVCALLVGSAAPARAQLAGTYTLAPSGGDFSNFEDAAAALRDLGVDGPVVIEIAQATYNERLDLGNVPGASATNTITFRGIPLGATLPVLTYTPSAGEPNVVHLAKAHWVRLEALRFEIANRNQSFGTVIRIDADDVTVSDCQIRSITAASVGANDAVGIDVHGNNVVVQDTDIDEGDIGIRYGLGLSGATQGGQILRNDLDRNKSAGILAEDQAIASGNAISIRENAISQNAVDVVGWVGIWARDITRGVVLARNRVTPRSGLGIRIENVAIPSTNYVSVVNNVVMGSAFGIQPGSGIEILNTDRARVQNNSVLIEDQNGTALFVDAASSGVDIRNNILVHEGEGMLIDVESEDSITAMDFQAYDAPEAATRFRARWQGIVHTDFAQFTATAGRDDNGIVWPVEFGFALHLDGRSDGDGRLMGTPLPGSVPFDIDGDPRDPTRPYRGADEAPTPLADPPPFMSGAYDIVPGGSGARTYPSFGSAFADLDLRGIDAPVTFTVAPGLFVERPAMTPVPGAAATRTVSFIAPGGTPTLQYDAASASEAVLKLVDVRHVRFEGIRFRAMDAEHAAVIEVLGGRDITFDGCIFKANSPTAVGTLVRIGGNLSQSASNASAIRVLHSTFEGGSRAVDLFAINANIDFHEEGFHEISGNTISGLVTPPGSASRVGIDMGGTVSGVIRGNTILLTGSNANTTGIRVGSGSAGIPVSEVIVEANDVRMLDGTGIEWERYRESTTGPSPALRLANNSVRMDGDGATVGLRLLDTDGLVAVYNSASVASTDPASTAAKVSIIPQISQSDIDLRNNILDAHLGRALDLDLPTLSSRFVHDYNAYASDGPVLARLDIGSHFTGDCADLDCIQDATATVQSTGNQDLHSIDKRIAFVDAETGDLRLAPTMEGLYELRAAVIPEVPHDIDGETRGEIPYRGADEAEGPIRAPRPGISIVINGRLGFRYLGAPATGVTVDALADLNLVRGVPGYYPNARAPNLWTDYDPVVGSWIPALGTGEELQLGHGFRWQMYDRNQGNPNVSLGYEFPVVIWVGRVANTSDVDVTLDTDGARFNFLANPFGRTLDLTDIATWPGGGELSPNAPLWVYDAESRTWVEDPTEVVPWQAFRVKAKGPRANGNPRVITIPFEATHPPQATRPASAARRAETPRLAFSLSGTDAQGDALADRALSLRFADDADDGFDADEDTEKFQVPDVAYALIGARTDGQFLGHDVRPFAEADIPLAIEARGTGARFTLAWDASALPSGPPVTLIDLETGDETDVRTTSSVTFETTPLDIHSEAPLGDLSDGADATDRFVLRIGAGAVSAEDPITEVTLSPVAPNPSAGNARIAFALPEAGTVRLTAFDVRGREIAVLADGPRSAGRHEARLGGTLAAGVYLVRLEAGGTVVTRQAVVVR